MGNSARVAIIVALIGLLGASVPLIEHFFSSGSKSSEQRLNPTTTPQSGPSLRKAHTPPPAPKIQNGDNDSLDDHSNNSGQQVGAINGSNNQVNQILGSNEVTINQLPPTSTHPVTFGMGLKWTLDDFAETVRNGNFAAIKEYLNPKDGFDPNALWNGNEFVLQLPIFEGTKDFPEILKLFKDTGKLNWNEVNERHVFTSVYQHPITQQWALLQEAVNKHRPADLKALIDAGANPSQLIADEIGAFNAPPSRDLLYKGALTERARDMRGASAEQELATFKSIGYALPNLQQALADASRSPKDCEQGIRAHHPIKELLEIAEHPQTPSKQELEWQPYLIAAFYLQQKSRFGPLVWQGDGIEYARAIATACSPSGTF